MLKKKIKVKNYIDDFIILKPTLTPNSMVILPIDKFIRITPF